MKKLISFIITATLSFTAFASAHSEQELMNTYPGASNTELIQIEDIKSVHIQDALLGIDIAFEKGDGYYDVVKKALYAVHNKNNELIGYMVSSLLSYTEDPEYHLVAAFVNKDGLRVGEVQDLNVYLIGFDEQELAKLPEELQP